MKKLIKFLRKSKLQYEIVENDLLLLDTKCFNNFEAIKTLLNLGYYFEENETIRYFLNANSEDAIINEVKKLLEYDNRITELKNTLLIDFTIDYNRRILYAYGFYRLYEYLKTFKIDFRTDAFSLYIPKSNFQNDELLKNVKEGTLTNDCIKYKLTDNEEENILNELKKLINANKELKKF